MNDKIYLSKHQHTISHFKISEYHPFIILILFKGENNKVEKILSRMKETRLLIILQSPQA